MIKPAPMFCETDNGLYIFAPSPSGNEVYHLPFVHNNNQEVIALPCKRKFRMACTLASLACRRIDNIDELHSAVPVIAAAMTSIVQDDPGRSASDPNASEGFYSYALAALCLHLANPDALVNVLRGDRSIHDVDISREDIPF